MTEAEREEEITRNNNLLLRKMQLINNLPGKHDWHKIEGTLPYSHGTLNEVARNMKSRRINNSNIAILGKIQKASTHYPAEQIEDAAERSNLFKQSIISNSSKNLVFELTARSI